MRIVSAEDEEKREGARFVLLTFESTHSAIETQQRLAALRPTTLPVPREIQASCGIALRFPASVAGEVFDSTAALRELKASACYDVFDDVPHYRQRR